jgi:hypothetical protein
MARHWQFLSPATFSRRQNAVPLPFFLNISKTFSLKMASAIFRLHHTYHPQTNGMVERVNGMLEKMLAKMCGGVQGKWGQLVEGAV